MYSLRVFSGLLLAAGIAFAQPSISAVVNNASGILPGLPNADIAQGSIFLIVGTGLGPEVTAVSPAPFQTSSYGGTTVNVTPATGAAFNAPLYYTSATQVSALLPSGTATGAATVTVNYNGQTSSSANFTIVVNNLGIFTQGQDGQGAAVVTNPDYSLVSAVPGTGTLGGQGPGTFHGAANPGDTLTLWTTGLGPVSGNELGGAGLGVNMPSIPLSIWIGGVQVQPVYQGRSGCCIGEDQVAFVVPANAPTGCAVPLLAQIGNLVSNATFIPIANGSRTCTPSNPALTSSALQGLSAGPPPPTFGEIVLQRQLASTTNGAAFQDIALGTFGQVTVPNYVQPILASYFDSPPLGTCTTFNSLAPATLPSAAISGVDAGKITITNSSGAVTMTEKPTGGQATQYSYLLSPTATYFTGGAYTVTVSGSAQVSNFSVRFSITAPPSWPSDDQFRIAQNGVTLANGMTLNWTGGSSAYYVEIDGKAGVSGSTGVGAGFSCLVPSTAGSFTVPPNVMLALPTGGGAEVDFKPTLVPVPISAPGLTFGSLEVNFETSVFPGFN